MKRANRPAVADAVKSVFYKSAVSAASSMAGKPGRALSLVSLAATKLVKIGNKEGLANLKDGLFLLIRMIRAVFKKQYNVPWATLVRALSAVIYFVFLIDLIPDFIPLAGLLDDMAVLAWVMSSIEKDLQRFKAWEENTNELRIDVQE